MNSKNYKQTMKSLVSKFFSMLYGALISLAKKFSNLLFGVLFTLLFTALLGGIFFKELQFLSSYPRILLAIKNYINPPSISPKHFVVLIPWMENGYDANKGIRRVIRSINRFEKNIQIIELAHEIIPDFINEHPDISWDEALNKYASNTLNTWQTNMVIIGEVISNKEKKFWTFYSTGNRVIGHNEKKLQINDEKFEDEFVRYVSDVLRDMAIDIAKEAIENPQNVNNNIVLKISNLTKSDLLFKDRYFSKAELYEINGDLTLNSAENESISEKNNRLRKNAIKFYENSLDMYITSCQKYTNDIPIKEHELNIIVSEIFEIWYKIIDNYTKINELERRDRRNLEEILSAYEKPTVWFKEECISSTIVTGPLNEDRINNILTIINKYIQNRVDSLSDAYIQAVNNARKI